jgi:hypothetical protein
MACVRSRSAGAATPIVGVVLALALAASLAGCAALGPLAMLSALVPDGGGAAPNASPGTGALSSAPSAVQNALQDDPAVRKALDTDQTVLDACRQELPLPQPPLPEEGCVVRPICIPGAAHPTPMRICARGVEPAPTHLAGTPRPPAPQWQWDRIE